MFLYIHTYIQIKLLPSLFAIINEYSYIAVGRVFAKIIAF